jgi:hypothetical protein
MAASIAHLPEKPRERDHNKQQIAVMNSAFLASRHPRASRFSTLRQMELRIRQSPPIERETWRAVSKTLWSLFVLLAACWNVQADDERSTARCATQGGEMT